jgi:transposase
LAKHVFQVHCVDAGGKVVVARALRRREMLPFFASLPACTVGMEACGSAHHWGRELVALGHEVRLIAPVYVKPFVRRQKNDANDAAAIHETLGRPGLRFVKVRSIENQATLMQHKAREMLVQQRTQLLNGLRGHLNEIGVIAAQGSCNMRALGVLIHEGDDVIVEAVRASLLPCDQAVM